MVTGRSIPNIQQENKLLQKDKVQTENMSMGNRRTSLEGFLRGHLWTLVIPAYSHLVHFRSITSYRLRPFLYLQNLNTLTPTSPTILHNVESKFTIRHPPLQISLAISIQCPFLLYARLHDSPILPHQQRRRHLYPRPTPTIQNQQIRHLRAPQQRRPETCRR